MPEYLSPGVYVEEYESGSVPVEGVSTSTAGFIGCAEKGPVQGRPVLLTSFSDYQRHFGGFLPESIYAGNRYLPYAAEQFFTNGGARCYVMRVAPQDAKPAVGNTPQLLYFEAKSPGEWGNRIKIEIQPVSRQKTQVLEVNGSEIRVKNADGLMAGDIVTFDEGARKTCNKIITLQGNTLTLEKMVNSAVIDTNLAPSKYMRSSEFNMTVYFDEQKEEYPYLSLNELSPDYVGARLSKSEFINIGVKPLVLARPAAQNKKDVKEPKEGKGEEARSTEEPGGLTTPYETVCGKTESFRLSLSGGLNGDIGNISAADYIGNNGGPGNRTGIQSFLEIDNVNIMAVPGITLPDVQLSLVAHCENTKSRFAILDMPQNAEKIDALLEHRDMFDSSYGALYHPWIESFDALSKKSIYMPPSGALAGIYARTDITVGVHKAPANEAVQSCTGLAFHYNTGEQDMLNPVGINLIRSFPGRGVRVWGARTVASNAAWKYINVRRLFIFLEESIKANTNWVVFEPNSEILWMRVKRSIEMFLTTVWNSGALAGTTPEQAFFVDIGPNTMSQDDLDNGRLICVIGVAPVKPAEFVIFRIGQYTADANV